MQRVGALQDRDSFVLPEFPSERAVRRVHGENMSGSALKQTIGKTSEVAADIGADESRHLQLERVKRRDELETAATLRGADLTGASFTGTIDAPATSAVVFRGSSNEGIMTAPSSVQDEMNDHGALLYQADFSGANLSGVIFNHENDALDATGWEEAIWTGAHFHYLDPPHLPDGMVHYEHDIVIAPAPTTMMLLAAGPVCEGGGWLGASRQLRASRHRPVAAGQS